MRTWITRSLMTAWLLASFAQQVAADPQKNILSCRIRPDGWTAEIVVDGMAPPLTYAFGLGTNNADLENAKVRLAVRSKGFDSSGLATTVDRTLYGTAVLRVPYSTSTIAGTFNAGTFADGETVTQTTSAATGIVVGDQSAGASLRIKCITGTPDNAHVWTGGTSGATFTASATAVALADNAPDELYDGTHTKVTIALSDNVYAKDEAGSGKSGTDPKLTLSLSWCTDGVNGNSETFALNCTNDSTRDYPTTFGQWENSGITGFYRVTGDFRLGFAARNRFGIAVVLLTATGATSGHDALADTYLRTQGKRLRTATGLYGCAYYSATVPIAGYTDGEVINCRAIAYPTVGDSASVLDTSASAYSAANEILGNGPVTLTCDKSGSLKVYAVVDLSTGNDSTGVSSTTLSAAEAAPFATIGKALQGRVGSAATVVYLRAGTHAAVGTAPATTLADVGYWRTVTYHPSVAAADVVVQTNTTRTYKTPRLCFENLKIQNGTSGYLDGGGSGFLWFKGCTFDANSITAGAGFGYNSYGCYFTDSTGMDVYNHRFGSSSTTRVAYWFDGCTFTGTSSRSIDSCWNHAVGNASSGVPILWIDKSAANPAPDQVGLLFEFNRFLRHPSSGDAMLWFGTARNMVGVSIVGNVLEKTSTVSPLCFLGGDASKYDLSHFVVWHNTGAGERCNFGYNDGTGSGDAAGSHTRYDWSMQYNAWRSWNNKDDTFDGSGGKNGMRIGSWPVGYNVGTYGDRREISGGAEWVGEFAGLDTAYVGDDGIAFKDNASYSGDNSGDGDYTPAAGSVLLRRVVTPRIPYDLNGRPIKANGAAGAIQRSGAKGSAHMMGVM